MNLPADIVAFLNSAKLILETATYAAAVFAIPWVSIRFLRDLTARRRERAAQIYASIDQCFRDNQALALSYPRLEGGEFEHPDSPIHLTGDEKVQQWILFDIITSGFEVCYLTYLDNKDDPSFRQQWEAWRGYMYRHCRKRAYRQWLETIELPRVPDADHLYDPRFNETLRTIYAETAPPSVAAQ